MERAEQSPTGRFGCSLHAQPGCIAARASSCQPPSTVGACTICSPDAAPLVHANAEQPAMRTTWTLNWGHTPDRTRPERRHSPPWSRQTPAGQVLGSHPEAAAGQSARDGGSASASCCLRLLPAVLGNQIQWQRPPNAAQGALAATGHLSSRHACHRMPSTQRCMVMDQPPSLRGSHQPVCTCACCW